MTRLMVDEDSLTEIRYKSYNRKNVNEISNKYDLPDELLEEIKIVSMVLPFRTNDYVIDQLIDWEQITNDPIFNLNFPQKSM